MRQAVIVASARTPLAKSHRGSFNLTRPDDLAAHAIAAVLDQVPALDRAEVEEVILGCGQPHGAAGHNVARVAALRAGLPVATAGLTVNRYCNSGLQAIVCAAQSLAQGDTDVVIAGGAEQMSQGAYLMTAGRWGIRMGDSQLKDCMLGVLHDPFEGIHMGMTAENVAARKMTTPPPQSNPHQMIGRSLPPRRRMGGGCRVAGASEARGSMGGRSFACG